MKLDIFVHVLACLVVLVWAPRRVSATVCVVGDITVPECEDPRARDLLFLVDASNTMDRERFFSEMLDFVAALYCAFSPLSNNQAGLILFSSKIFVRIPLDEYSRNEWSDLVEDVRSDDSSCCECCTRKLIQFG